MQYRTYSRHIFYMVILFGLPIFSGCELFRKLQKNFWPSSARTATSVGQKHTAGQKHRVGYTLAENKDGKRCSDPGQQIVAIGGPVKQKNERQGLGSGCYRPPSFNPPVNSGPDNPPINSHPKIISDFDFLFRKKIVCNEQYCVHNEQCCLIYQETIQNSGANETSAPEMLGPRTQQMPQQSLGQILHEVSDASNVEGGMNVENEELNLENEEIPAQPVELDNPEVLKMPQEEGENDGVENSEEDKNRSDPLEKNNSNAVPTVAQEVQHNGEVRNSEVDKNPPDSLVEEGVMVQSENNRGGVGEG